MKYFYTVFFCPLLLFLFLAGISSCSHDTQEPEPVVPAGALSDSLTVLEYRPAMGQFVNILPEYRVGDTYQDMLLKAQQSLRQGSVITLGGFGGYITVSLGSSIKNLPDKRDFRVLGNAFMAQGSTRTGNSEPGIVLVSQDVNLNGLPDDTWYELAGSEYFKPETTHNYEKTWHKSDTTLNNPFHRQPYFPQWLTDTVIHVSGTLLSSHMVAENGVVAQQVLEFGYADNYPNTDSLGTAFDLDWAVDQNGIHVQLGYCDFVRIQTAVDEVYTMIGELSTEVAGVVVIKSQK